MVRKLDKDDTATDDRQFVRSIEKLFRIFNVFDGVNSSLSLTQLAHLTGLDKSAVQRFTNTLTKLGYLKKNKFTKHYELTSLCLDLGQRYTRSNVFVSRAFPYLIHLSGQTEEAVSLTCLEQTEVVYVSRIMSRHMLSTDIIVGSRLPAYCTAPGIAMLSRLDRADALAILERSHLKAYTPSTTWHLPDLVAKIDAASEQGYAMNVEEVYFNDITVAAAIIGSDGDVQGAVSLGVSKHRYSSKQVEQQYSQLVVATAQSMSMAAAPGGVIR